MNATRTAVKTERMSRMGLLNEPAGYADGLNQYEFVRSNPLSFVDPLGLQGGPTTQPVGELPPGARGPTTVAVEVPGLGTIYVRMDNWSPWNTGGSGSFVSYFVPDPNSNRCKECKTLSWSQKIHITINDPGTMTPDQIAAAKRHEIDEHGGNDPFGGSVLDNGLGSDGKPRPVAEPLTPDEINSFLPGVPPSGIGFGDGPKMPPDVWPPGSGANITKDFELTLLCDGKPLGPMLHWRISGTAGQPKKTSIGATVTSPSGPTTRPVQR